ncbi:MAG: cell surface protein SprA, partial [Proteiniphilum sp.]
MNGKYLLHAQISLSGIRTEVHYDHLSGLYIFENKIGNMVVGTSHSMTSREYMEYRLRRTQTDYFRKRNTLHADSLQPPITAFSLSGMRKRQDPLETIFGPGGVRLTTQGYLEISAGMNRNVTDNPTLPQRARKRTMFDFDQQIQLNVNAKVGDKIDFDINYDTEATFDFQSKQLKLAYQGNEDEIIQHIEAGNVSMNSSNSLIQAGVALFGIKSELQFGKLRINSLFSQQQSESQTINTRGGIQTIPYEFSADQYDENRHFFLGYWFREKYDKALEKLPYIQSPVSITRMEVWVTNKRGDYAQARNIIAFADLGEEKYVHNSGWVPQDAAGVPHNNANTLYGQLTGIWAGARVSSETAQIFPGSVIAGMDYEKLENARRLTSAEYSFQPQLGYLSLRMPLQPDEVLAVAYEFTYRGEVYQVGEFSSDMGDIAGNNSSEDNALFLKLLKPVSLSPRAYTWDLMMKNIYSIGQGAYNIQRDQFRLQITWQSDTAGVYLNYIPESIIGDELLLQLLHLDRLNSRNDPSPDGIFDFLEGYTVDSQNGQIIFPVLEPFGSYLREKIGNETIAEKYVYQELYDSTLTMARQLPEKNKFRISGEYRGSSGSEINLNAMNVARGSVRITAAGTALTEGIDYTVDYLAGTVNIINQAILAAGTPVSITLESQQLSQMQRKTLMGLDMNYDFSKNVSLGATLMHYSEKPLTMKSAFGDESSKNTLWGTHLNYRKQSYLLTNLIDMLPFVEATVPSQLTANLAFAQMLPGHYKNKYTGGYSYLDDFESSTSAIDLRTPYAWSLAATPYNNTSSGLFPEASRTNNIDYGKNRAQLAWFYIDGIFTRRNSNLTPVHIKNDADQLSDHRVREVYEREIFPNRDALYGQPATLPVLNLSFYPDERGPYNLDTDVDGNGRLHNPSKRWGGITRRMETRDFEAANIEYIEFWLMDPFMNDTTGTSRGGDLYFNLG